MMNLCAKIVERLQGRTLVTAESLTGGGIGTALTCISGSSAIYKGGVISYTDWVKSNVLGVNVKLLEEQGVDAVIEKLVPPSKAELVALNRKAMQLGKEFKA